MLKHRASLSVSSCFVYGSSYWAVSTHKFTLLAVTQFPIDFFNERDLCDKSNQCSLFRSLSDLSTNFHCLPSWNKRLFDLEGKSFFFTEHFAKYVCWTDGLRESGVVWQVWSQEGGKVGHTVTSFSEYPLHMSCLWRKNYYSITLNWLRDIRAKIFQHWFFSEPFTT